MHTCIHTCMHTYIRVHACVRACTHPPTHTHIYIHTCSCVLNVYANLNIHYIFKHKNCMYPGGNIHGNELSVLPTHSPRTHLCRLFQVTMRHYPSIPKANTDDSSRFLFWRHTNATRWKGIWLDTKVHHHYLASLRSETTNFTVQDLEQLEFKGK